MAILYKPGKNKGIEDVSIHIGKDYTDEEKETIIHESISNMYIQLQGNATNVCTYNSDIWSDNLLADILEGFLARKIEAKWKIYMEGRLERYLTSAMSMAIKSSSSAFYHKYRKGLERSRELFHGYDYGADNSDNSIKYKELLDNVENEVSELHFYYRDLINKHYYQNISTKEISKELKISTNTITRDIRIGLQILKDKLQNEFQDI